MNVLSFAILFSLLASISVTQDIPKVWIKPPHLETPKVWEPKFTLQGGGTGSNAKNWNANFNAGIGTKVWESKNKMQSVDVGATYGQGFVRHQGQTFKSEPRYGLGVNYRFGRK